MGLTKDLIDVDGGFSDRVSQREYGVMHSWRM